MDTPLGAALALCSPVAAAREIHGELLRLACDAMGTRFEVVIPVAEPAASARLRAAGEAALVEIALWHARLSFFEASSFLSHINREAAKAPVVCDPEVFELLALCRDLWQQTGGAFDPAIAAHMHAGGFRGAPRDEAALARAAAIGGFARVQVHDATRSVRFETPDIRLDLGAIAKGWALDRAAAELRDAGVASALLHGGTSSVLAIGTPPGHDAWWIGLATASPDVRPDHPASPRVRLVDFALGVSSPRGRLVQTRGEGVHGHVLDPRTGASARGCDLAAIACRSAALADAWSTAVLVNPELADRLPGDFECALGFAAALDQPDAQTWHVSGAGQVIVRTR